MSTIIESYDEAETADPVEIVNFLDSVKTDKFKFTESVIGEVKRQANAGNRSVVLLHRALVRERESPLRMNTLMALWKAARSADPRALKWYRDSIEAPAMRRYVQTNPEVGVLFAF